MAEGEVWLLVYYDNAEVLVVPYSVKVEPQMLDMRAAVEPYGTTVQLEPLDARIDA